jgi:translation initiation factor IF-2
MTVSKVRIYDLAKELKLDTKRLIEEVRREGVDVSVPSNSVSKELAEKIRTKYFPKKETTVKRAVKVVKKAARPVTEEAPEAAEGSVAVAAPEAEPLPEEFVETAPVETPAPEIKHTPAARVIKKLTPAVRAEQPPPITEPVEEIEEPLPPPAVVDAEPVAEPVAAATARQPETRPAAPPPPSRQVRVLRPTAAALDAGIRPGDDCRRHHLRGSAGA